jgi:hypothetical protein
LFFSVKYVPSFACDLYMYFVLEMLN